MEKRLPVALRALARLSLRRNTEDKEVKRHGGSVGFLLMIALVFLLLAQFSLVLRKNHTMCVSVRRKQ